MKKRIALASLVIALGLCLVLSAAAGPFDPDTLIDLQKMKPKGTWEDVTWPDTLDLSDRARIALEGALTLNPDPAHHYIYAAGFGFQGGLQPMGLEWFHSMSYLQSIPYARTMSGSEANMDAEAAMMRVHLENLSDDGMLYWPETADEKQGTTSYQKNGFSVFTMVLTWYERDKNPAWLDMARLMTKNLVHDYPPGPGVVVPHLPVIVEDRAYYPPECTFDRKGVVLTSGRGKSNYKPGEEPQEDRTGVEQAARWYVTTGPIGAVAALHRYTGDTSRLDLAQRLVRFALKPGMWYLGTTFTPQASISEEGVPCNEHGMHHGHMTCNVHNMVYLLDYAVVFHDDSLKQIVREGFDYFISNSVKRMGYIFHGGETDFTSYYMALGVRLTDAGLGDCWDDIDSIVRNRLVEQQFTDLDVMRKFSGNNPKNDLVLKRYLGGFGVALGATLWTTVFGSNSQSGPYGMYHAWHAITRFDHGVATVNLFLNRVSPWMNVASWLPYDGKVELTNKQAHTADVRIPGWLELDDVKTSINGVPVEPSRAGHHLIFRKLKPGDVIRLEFDQPESVDQYFVPSNQRKLAIHLRGSTVLDLSPRDHDPTVIPMMMREHLKAKKAPMHKVRRFASENILPLQ